MARFPCMVFLLFLAGEALGEDLTEVQALMSNSARPHPVVATPSRSKRAVDTNKKSVTEEERKEFVDKHNDWRKVVNPSASDMRLMSWNADLESMGQDWANLCTFDHGQPARDKKPFSHIGQNIWAGSGGYSPSGSVTSWNKEVSDYSYSTGTCTKVCGHYTQVVWASSHAVGCGIKFCPSLKVGQSMKTNWYIIVCNYGPAGNWVGQKPYTEGNSCSACPEDAANCKDKLCATDAQCEDGSCNSVGTRAPDMLISTLMALMAVVTIAKLSRYNY